MEGYEFYRLSDEEIQHVGVKGMKWGKRKSRSAYMTAVDKHEAKTKANRQKVADHKAREKEAGKEAFKKAFKKGQDIANAKSKEKSDKKAINAENRKTKVKLSKDEKDAIAEEKFWAKDAKDKARVERNKARMAKVMGQKAVDVLTAPENRVKIAAVTSVIAAYAGTQMGSSKNARLMREFNSHNYKI